MPLPYITGYTDEVSLRRSERLRVMVSCTAAKSFDAALVRVRCGDLNPEGPGFSETVIPSDFDGTYPAREQLANAGSCIIIPLAEQSFNAFTAMAHIWPTAPDRGDQVVLSLGGPGAGFRLLISEGCLTAELSGPEGISRVSNSVPLVTRQWALVAISLDNDGTLSVLQEPYIRSGAGERPVESSCDTRISWSVEQATRLLIAAEQGEDDQKTLRTKHHFNGKIEKPRLARKALSRLQIETLREGKVPPNLADDVL